jgi:hypothetical protein
LVNSVCALASAAARQAMDSLDRCMVALLDVQVEGYGIGLRALSPDAITDRLQVRQRRSCRLVRVLAVTRPVLLRDQLLAQRLAYGRVGGHGPVRYPARGAWFVNPPQIESTRRARVAFEHRGMTSPAAWRPRLSLARPPGLTAVTSQLHRKGARSDMVLPLHEGFLLLR